MTNFDFLKKEQDFRTFADAAIAAEKIINLDTAACAINCRRAMEIAVKWMYSVDADLSMPYQDKLVSLMNSEDFRQIVGADIWKRMDLIRKIGNQAAHGNGKIKYEEAKLCLKNLYIFLDFVAYCYGENYEETQFDEELLKSGATIELKTTPVPDVDLEKLIEENKKLKARLTEKREEKQQTYAPKPIELTEYQTRKIYIDTMMRDAGWIEDKNWLNEVEVHGMPNKAKTGFVDYVLYDDTHKPLAIIEAKKTCVGVEKGRHQAKLYADILEKQYGRRPVIFLTNGLETRIIDNQYPERKVSSIYSKRDLEKLFNLRRTRSSLKYVKVNTQIAGRYYQEAAVRAVCDSFGAKNRRKALLVMATGSGKTRTVIALCDVLLNAGWVKNILFLADRTALVTQAKRSFTDLLPNLSVTNLCEDKENYNAHCVFSTYQTMAGCIDTVEDEEGRLFTCGHFDLIICDEAHRSIYNKYKDIFTYFDTPLVGLTATPKDEIDKNTYQIFELENGVPTYGYDLAQAVKDGYLVDYLSVETKLKFIEQGIVYDELSEADKEAFEETFETEDGKVPEKIDSSALNTWIFNEDTISHVLHILMTDGLRIDYGEKLGKTIIFAKNHYHAEKILEVFHKEYPHLPNYAMVIDNYMTYAQDAIDQFSDHRKMPQIAISVDMLDTGIDVPEILNLVFFKKVMSKAKFWQMIGRGTRLCPGLLDGKDKEKFYIFDFCGNFEFFRMNPGKPTANQLALQGAVFNLEFQIAYKLQDIDYQTEPLIEFRKDLVDKMSEKVKKLDRDNFAIRQHIKYVDKYSDDRNYNALTFEDTITVKEEVSLYIYPDKDDASAVRFDALMYGIELAYLAGKQFGRYKSDLLKRVSAVARIANIPEIQAKTELIKKILETDYLERAGINDFEHIRSQLRDLMKYIPKDVTNKYNTNFDDDILSLDWNEAELDSEDLKNYRAKAEFYVRQHKDNIVIAKLRTNKPLTEMDVQSLENILWSQVGTQKEYEAEYGNKPLGEFVREIVGLDMNAAKEAFAQFLDGSTLDSRQIYFVNQIVEYIVHNGMMKDLSVLQESPFTDKGSVAEIFTDMSVWNGIRKVIDTINSNAIA